MEEKIEGGEEQKKRRRRKQQAEETEVERVVYCLQTALVSALGVCDLAAVQQHATRRHE